MVEIKNEKIAIPVVLFAGLLWSFGPLIVRYMDQPNQVPWQYLFTRGIVIFFLLNIYLFFEEGKDFYKNYFKVGISGLIGGCGLALAMITFIYSIINTSAAIPKPLIQDTPPDSGSGNGSASCTSITSLGIGRSLIIVSMFIIGKVFHLY